LGIVNTFSGWHCWRQIKQPSILKEFMMYWVEGAKPQGLPGDKKSKQIQESLGREGHCMVADTRVLSSDLKRHYGDLEVPYGWAGPQETFFVPCLSRNKFLWTSLLQSKSCFMASETKMYPVLQH
jgi:hypothetical protein